MVKFDVESKEISQMSHKQFESKIVFKRQKLVNGIGKTLEIRFEQIERLPPWQYKNGAKFEFIIETEVNDSQRLINAIHQNIQNDKLAMVCHCTWY